MNIEAQTTEQQIELKPWYFRLWCAIRGHGVISIVPSLRMGCCKRCGSLVTLP